MEKRLQIEGDPYSKVVQLIRKYGYNKDLKLVFGTVEESPPNIRVKLDNLPFELNKDDVTVFETLASHERIVTLEHVELAERDLGDRIETDYLDTDDKAYPATSYKHSYIKLKFEDVLKKGDRVAVLVSEEDMTFTILDRVVRYK
ncbi:DUF2577 family protein [Metabacillus fastidiosus]|uniref:DUF2577 family protein n=1 Tax=Metabacillus fastidiosus TaxID=1458 RepID=UPI002E1B399B|nr:DUF2577 family protein [Metabacillus fastidiosus]